MGSKPEGELRKKLPELSGRGLVLNQHQSHRFYLTLELVVASHGAGARSWAPPCGSRAHFSDPPLLRAIDGQTPQMDPNKIIR